MGTTDDRAGLDIDIEVEPVLDAALDAVVGRLYAFVVYSTEGFQIEHVDEALEGMYRDEQQMYDHFETIHSYVHIDFTERGLFENDLFPAVGPVRTFVTQMEAMTVIRIIHGDGGVFLSVEADEPVTPLVHAVEAQLRQQQKR